MLPAPQGFDGVGVSKSERVIENPLGFDTADDSAVSLLNQRYRLVKKYSASHQTYRK